MRSYKLGELPDAAVTARLRCASQRAGCGAHATVGAPTRARRVPRGTPARPTAAGPPDEFPAHAGSVNCLKIGRKSSGVLVTGGDDRKVNVWAIGKPAAILVSGQPAPQRRTHARARAAATPGAPQCWACYSMATRHAVGGGTAALLAPHHRAWWGTPRRWSASTLTRTRRWSLPADRMAPSSCGTSTPQRVGTQRAIAARSGLRAACAARHGAGVPWGCPCRPAFEPRPAACCPTNSRPSRSPRVRRSYPPSLTPRATAAVRTLTGHRSSCLSVAFHPFGDFAATGSLDTNLKVWDLRRKECIQTYKGHAKGITHVAVSPDGRWVVSGCERGDVKVRRRPNVGPGPGHGRGPARVPTHPWQAPGLQTPPAASWPMAQHAGCGDAAGRSIPCAAR